MVGSRVPNRLGRFSSELKDLGAPTLNGRMHLTVNLEPTSYQDPSRVPFLSPDSLGRALHSTKTP